MARTELKDHWQEQKLFLSRIIGAAIIVVLLSGLLVARLVQLQIVNYERFSELSQGNRFRIEPLPPNRGLIFDRNGLVIAENLPNWELVAIAEEIENLDTTLTQLEDLGLVDPSEHNTLRDLVRSHRGFERVKLSNLTEEQAATFAVRRHRFSGVDIQEALVRHYPFDEASAHAIGYVGSISLADLERIDRSDYAATSHIGKTGIERSYEAQLHGHVGYRQQVVNAQGRVLFDPAAETQAAAANAMMAGVPATRSPVPGNNIVLSIDMRLQLAAQEALGEFRGAVVAIDPRNGDVLALVSTPAFDPNRFAGGLSRADFVALNTDLDKPLFNRALAGVYPPGSTVKPFIALTALQHESIDPSKELYCPGEWRLPGFTHKYREGRGGVHGATDLHTAIVRSCDVYFYQLATADRHQRPRGRPQSVRLRCRDGPRHQRREPRRRAVTGVEEEAVRSPRRSGVVPRRDRHHRRRTGLHARHAAPARARRGDAGRARRPAHPEAPDRRGEWRHERGGVVRADRGGGCRRSRTRALGLRA